VASRVVVGDHAFVDVRDDLGVAANATGNVGTWRKPALVDGFEESESIGGPIAASGGIEGPPDLPLAASVMMALGGSADLDHRTTTSCSRIRTV
jgi:hypothetical protein